MVAQASIRPRYAFMVLCLIGEVARHDGSAGPFINSGGASVLLRDWLCEALTPMGARDPKRIAMAEKVRGELQASGKLSPNQQVADEQVEELVRERVHASGKTNLSRAVTELVKAGLIRRHYQGYRVDHLNRGAQRHAVYTLTGRARCLLSQRAPSRYAPKGKAVQGELALH